MNEMRIFLAAIALCAAVACYDANAGALPIAGIWEMDTSLTRYLAAEPRLSETFSCSEAGQNVRCAFVTEHADGMIYNTSFEATVDGPRAQVKGISNVQEVQLSFKDKPLLDLNFYNRSGPAYSWRVRRSTNGDTLFVDRVDITPEGPRTASTKYRRVRRELP
jgi:hypothetical protein